MGLTWVSGARGTAEAAPNQPQPQDQQALAGGGGEHAAGQAQAKGPGLTAGALPVQRHEYRPHKREANRHRKPARQEAEGPPSSSPRRAAHAAVAGARPAYSTWPKPLR